MSSRVSIDTLPLLRLFSSAVVKEWARQGVSPLARELFLNSNVRRSFVIKKKTTVRDFYDDIFKLLSSEDVQREYIFKSVIVSQLWRGVHTGESLLIPEFRVGECRADMVIFNGTSTAYEIKTERDNLLRLENQMREYSQMFDRIVLVTTQKIYESLPADFPAHVGVMIFDENKMSLAYKKKPTSNKTKVSPLYIFDSLRKDEYTEILRTRGYSLDNITPVNYRRVARECFEKMNAAVVHDDMVRIVKKRRNNKKLSSFLENMPKGLFSRLLSIHLSVREMKMLTHVMSQKIQEYI